jgi:hypothetical protein
VNGQAHRQPDRRVRHHPHFETSQRINQPQPGPYGPRRRHFVRDRIAKIDQQPRAVVPGDVPRATLDHLFTGGIKRLEDCPDILGIPPHPGEILHQGGAQHSELTPSRESPGGHTGSR